LKKEQENEAKYQTSLTKIKVKHEKDGKIYLRFPPGILPPKVLNQKPIVKISGIQKCEVLSCKNDKKYRDPVTKKYYCSVECYRALKNMMHVN
jgi:hypothetical protein